MLLKNIIEGILQIVLTASITGTIMYLGLVKHYVITEDKSEA